MTITITRQPTGRFELENNQTILPDIMAGLENVFEIELNNTTNYTIYDAKLEVNRKDCTIEYPKQINPNSCYIIKLIYQCPQDIDEEAFGVQFTFSGKAKKGVATNG